MALGQQDSNHGLFLYCNMTFEPTIYISETKMRLATGIPVENLGFVVKEDTGNSPTSTENTRSLARSWILEFQRRYYSWSSSNARECMKGEA